MKRAVSFDVGDGHAPVRPGSSSSSSVGSGALGSPDNNNNNNNSINAKDDDELSKFHQKYKEDSFALRVPKGGTYTDEKPGSDDKEAAERWERHLKKREARRERRRELMALQLEVEQLRTDLICKPRKQANAGPIGLLGFGMTTVLLNLHNTGYFPLYSVIPAMGICYGGGAQFIAGVLEFTKGNTFSSIAFISYGSFWLSLVCVWMLPNSSYKNQMAVQPTTSYMLGVYLIIWGLFSFLMMCCTFRMNVAICVVFVTVTLLFFLLGGSNMAGNSLGVKVAGYEGIICGCSALYLAFAELLNEVWDRTILPIIPLGDLWGCCERRSPSDPIQQHTPAHEEAENASPFDEGQHAPDSEDVEDKNEPCEKVSIPSSEQ